jgi:hypothetical protein
MEEMITIPRSEYEQMKSGIAEPKNLVRRLMEEIGLLKNGRNSRTGSAASSHNIELSNSITYGGTNLRHLIIFLCNKNIITQA